MREELRKAFVRGALYWNEDHHGKTDEEILDDIVREARKLYPDEEVKP